MAKRHRSLILFIVLVVGLGWIMGASNLPGAWYASLQKASFNLPNWIFGPAGRSLCDDRGCRLADYQTSQGFYDLAIAVPSMKAAFETWGAGGNLFHQGFAKEVDDAKTVAATLAKPGVVLKRPVTVKTTKNNTIFVVHGRDHKLNEDMFTFLRHLGLNAIEFSEAIAQTPGANPNKTKVVKGALKRAQGYL